MKNVMVFSRQFFAISETFIYRQVTGAKDQHNVSLVAFEFVNNDKFPIADLKRLELKLFYSAFDRVASSIFRRLIPGYPRFSSVALKKLQHFIQQENIEIIHAHYGLFGVRILPVAKKYQLPLIVSFHGYDASKSLRNVEYVNQLKSLFDYASCIVIVSNHMRHTLELEKYAHKTRYIPYGIDVDKFKRSAARLSRKEIKILHAGRLTPKKGVPDLIRVFTGLADKYSHISLHIIGEGSEIETCQTIAALVAGRVTFYKSQPIDVVIETMNDCDIFVLNSRTSENGDMEGLPNALLEAMSMEMAVVSTRHAGIPDAVKHLETGMLVNEKDNDELATALVQLIENPEMILSLGSRARAMIIENFTVQKMNHALSALYREIDSANNLP
jgi:colanic acid/amylovoran biosynthesis glycosyltransferase